MREPVVDSRSVEALRAELHAVRACLQEAHAELEILREALTESRLETVLALSDRWAHPRPSFVSSSSPANDATAPF